MPTLKVGGVVVLPNPDADGAGHHLGQIRQTGSPGAGHPAGVRRAGPCRCGSTSPLPIVFADLYAAPSPTAIYQHLLARWEAAGLGEQEKADRSVRGDSS